MSISVSEAARRVEPSGLLKRSRRPTSPDRIIAHVRELIGQELPRDLEDFYRDGIIRIGGYSALTNSWNDWVGWDTEPEYFTKYLDIGAIEVFSDECGNPYVLDLTAGDQTPAVYFIDHEDDPPVLAFAAASSLSPAYC